MPSSNNSQPNSRQLYWLLGAMTALLLISLFNHPLIPSMEPRFAEAVREMMARGSYLIPIKNGVPYIEYPPLYFWLCILGKFIGLPDTAAVRLPSAVAFLFWIHGLFRLQRLLKPEWPPLLLPLAGAALPIVLVNFFIAQTDGLLALGVLIGMIGYCEYQLRPPDSAAKVPWKFWLGATLAVAAKGPVGLVLTVFPVAVERIVSVLIEKPASPIMEIWRRGFALFPIRGLALVLLVNGPWYLAAGLREGWDFCRAVVIYQNFTRFFVGFDHLQPWWYYLKTISYDLFPYSLLLPLGLWFAWKNRADFVCRFSTSWILTTVIFFSISHAKQGKYLLPAAPGFVMLWLSATLGAMPTVIAMLRYTAKIILVLFAISLLALSYIFRQVDATNAAALTGFHIEMDIARKGNPGGQLFTYGWPRSPVLYEFGAPLPYVRSSRDLFEAIRSKQIQSGDFLLVDKKYYSKFRGPVKNPLDKLLDRSNYESLHASEPGDYLLFRVLPGAASASAPPTPEPPPVQWWEKFDTD